MDELDEAEHEPMGMPVVAAVAGLAIKAGIAMTADGDELTLPNRGWMPPPATGSPECEYGMALAIQAIISTFDLDPIQVNEVADALLGRAGI